MTNSDRGRRGLTRNAVVWFVAADVVAMVLIAGVGLAIARRISTTEAIRDARGVVETDARHVEPVITDGLFSGDQQSFDNLDQVIRPRVLSDQVVRVKVWDSGGRIVYSDQPGLVGERHSLGADELEALQQSSTAADSSDLTKPENRYERSYGKLLEVYSGVRTKEGTKVLFEAYLRFDKVADNGSRILAAFAPALIGGLIALFLIQIPLAVGLSRRVERAEAGRRRSLQQAVESSDRERRRIAADLHDSVVQGLAGSSLSLAAMAEESERAGSPVIADRLRDRSAELRQWERELRTLIVSMVPPRLHEEGLTAALIDMTSSLAAKGIESSVKVDPAIDLSDASESLLFRAAQEAVRNTVSHAGASHVVVSVAAISVDRVQLVVRDDGSGIDPEQLAEARSGGHVGLRLLTELVEQADGTLDVSSEPGVGTTITLEVAQR